MELHVVRIVLDRMPISHADLARMHDSGCEDAVFSLQQDQRPIATFARMAVTPQDAIDTALRDLKAAGLQAREIVS